VGAGKTTFAERLGKALGLPVIGLDSVVWRSGWVAASADERREKELAIATGDTWIVDGVSRIIRDAADTVIFLDVSKRVAIWRCARRSCRYLFMTRPGLPARCPEVLILPKLPALIRSFDCDVRPRLLSEMETAEPKRSYVRLRTEQEVESYLASVRSRNA
jgi:adenylate kinase family enzyme